MRATFAYTCRNIDVDDVVAAATCSTLCSPLADQKCHHVLHRGRRPWRWTRSSSDAHTLKTSTSRIFCTRLNQLLQLPCGVSLAFPMKPQSHSEVNSKHNGACYHDSNHLDAFKTNKARRAWPEKGHATDDACTRYYTDFATANPPPTRARSHSRQDATSTKKYVHTRNFPETGYK
jgi:hypothetical protein